MMTQTEWNTYWADVEANSTPEVIAEPEREAREAREAARFRCVLCHGSKALSIVWSVSFGETSDRAEQVVVCGNCRKFCDVCEQYRVEDEVHSHRESGTGMCDRCRLVMFVENDQFSRVAYHRQELAQWDGADGPVAFEGAKLLEELKRSELELIARTAVAR